MPGRRAGCDEHDPFLLTLSHNAASVEGDAPAAGSGDLGAFLFGTLPAGSQMNVCPQARR